MPTFESAYVEYMKLKRPHFVKNNPTFPVVFSAAAVSLASRMWIDANDLIPAVWYIALVGSPRSGKTSFIRAHTRLLHNAGIPRIPEGSPEAMLGAINENPHGFIFYDEVSRLAKLMKSYLGTLPTILNLAYYLDDLNHTRTDKKKSITVPAQSYYLHTFFSGTREDWASVEAQAPGGFIRRSLVLPTRGIIPFFTKNNHDDGTLRRISLLERHIIHILYELRGLRLTMLLPGYPSLREKLDRAYLPVERKSMIEEYTYKLVAGRILANLIEVPLSKDPASYQLNEILHNIKSRAEQLGIGFTVVQNTSSSTEIILKMPSPDGGSDSTVDSYLLPHLHTSSYDILFRTTKDSLSVPAEAVAENLEKINAWLQSGGDLVVSKTTFIQKIFNSKNFAAYDKLLSLLEEGEYIRRVSGMFRGRQVDYFILDPKARICGNCAHLGTKKCPLVLEAAKKGKYFVVNKAALARNACDKFEPVGDDE